MTHIEKACELIVPPETYPHILEFGVWRGLTISLIERKIRGKPYSIYGFDSFKGLPEDWVNSQTNEMAMPKGFFDNKGETPNIKNVTLIKGWFDDTVPMFLSQAKDIALLHVDCDLYSSTKTVLYNLNNYIKKDTIIVFDEWIYCHRSDYNDHEQKCFYEWVRDFNRKYELINHHGPSDEQQIVKILE